MGVGVSTRSAGLDQPGADGEEADRDQLRKERPCAESWRRSKDRGAQYRGSLLENAGHECGVQLLARRTRQVR